MRRGELPRLRDSVRRGLRIGTARRGREVPGGSTRPRASRGRFRRCAGPTGGRRPGALRLLELGGRADQAARRGGSLGQLEQVRRRGLVGSGLLEPARLRTAAICRTGLGRPRWWDRPARSGRWRGRTLPSRSRLRRPEPGVAGLRLSGLGLAGLRLTRLGLARLGLARLGLARRELAGLRLPRLGLARRELARRELAGPGRPGTARLGLAGVRRRLPRQRPGRVPALGLLGRHRRTGGRRARNRASRRRPGLRGSGRVEQVRRNRLPTGPGRLGQRELPGGRPFRAHRGGLFRSATGWRRPGRTRPGLLRRRGRELLGLLGPVEPVGVEPVGVERRVVGPLLGRPVLLRRLGLRERAAQRPGEPGGPPLRARLAGGRLLDGSTQITGERRGARGGVGSFRLGGPRSRRGAAARVREPVAELPDPVPEHEGVGFGGQRRELGAQVEPARPGGRAARVLRAWFRGELPPRQRFARRRLREPAGQRRRTRPSGGAVGPRQPTGVVPATGPRAAGFGRAAGQRQLARGLQIARAVQVRCGSAIRTAVPGTVTARSDGTDRVVAAG